MILSVNYPRQKNDSEKDMQTTANIIAYAMESAYKEGFDGKGIQRRTYARIQRKIDKALEDEEITNIELEESEVDLIKKAIDQAKFPPAWSKFVVLLEDALEAM